MYNLIYNNHRITFGNINIGFELPYANITYSTVEHGTVSGVATAQIGSLVTVTATPSSGYELSYITVNGVQIVGNSFVVTGDTVVGAVFAQVIYTVTYSTVQHGSVAGVASAAYGSTVTITSTPDSGYALSYITVNGTQIQGNSFVITGNTTVGAVFTAVVRSVTTTASPAAGGSVTASPNSGIIGTEVTLSNTPAEGYNFNSYTISGATLSGNTFTIGESDVAVTGKFALAYGYYTATAHNNGNVTAGNCVSGIPIRSGYNYYVPVKEYMSGPGTLPDTFSYNVRGQKSWVVMNDNGPDNVTSLTINLDNMYNGIVIGDNTFNNLTSLSLNLGTQPLINIGNNSMNTASQITNFTLENAGACQCYIGDGSCRNFNLSTAGDTGPIKVGNNSLRTLTLKQDIRYYLSSGNFGAHLDVTPLIITGTRVELYGDIKSMIQASMNARSSSVKVIDAQGHSTTIRCPDCSSSDIGWLNSNKSNFIKNDTYNRVTFST